MRLAAKFGRWDVDEFLEEIPSDIYLEWMAYDAIESLDAAGAIPRGLAGSGEGGAVQDAPQNPQWMNQKMAMLKFFNMAGKKKK